MKAEFQIKKIKQADNFARFSFEPLPQGYGYTLGNALRRVLLTSLPGIAITQVKISGIRHKFSTLRGMKEDVVELLLNLKKVRIKSDQEKPIKLELEKTGPGEVKAGDIQAPAGVEIVNKELVLAHLADEKSKLKMEMIAERGVGYSPAEERKSEKLGVIITDAIFTPIKRVNYRVEATRVGRQTDLDRLIMELYTDGTIEAEEALREAARILISFFTQIVEQKGKLKIQKEEIIAVPSHEDDVLKLTLEEVGLPTRIVNSLQKAGYETVEEVVKAPKTDLMKVKNLGEKSLEIIENCLKERGIKLDWEKK